MFSGVVGCSADALRASSGTYVTSSALPVHDEGFCTNELHLLTSLPNVPCFPRAAPGYPEQWQYPC